MTSHISSTKEAIRLIEIFQTIAKAPQKSQTFDGMIMTFENLIDEERKGDRVLLAETQNPTAKSFKNIVQTVLSNSPSATNRPEDRVRIKLTLRQMDKFQKVASYIRSVATKPLSDDEALCVMARTCGYIHFHSGTDNHSGQAGFGYKLWTAQSRVQSCQIWF